MPPASTPATNATASTPASNFTSSASTPASNSTQAASTPVASTPVTIDSLNIYEDSGFYRYNVIGDAPASTNLYIQIIAPSGGPQFHNANDQSTSTGQPSYNHDGLIFNPNAGIDPTGLTETSVQNTYQEGTWSLWVCASDSSSHPHGVFYITDPTANNYIHDQTISCANKAFTLQVQSQPTSTSDN